MPQNTFFLASLFRLRSSRLSLHSLAPVLLGTLSFCACPHQASLALFALPQKGSKEKTVEKREREREGERESLITRSFLSSSLPSFRAPSFFRVCRLLSVRRDKRRESSAQSKNGGRAPSSPAGVQARRHGHRRQRFGRDDDASRCRGLRRRERGRPLHAPEDPAAPA